MWERYAVHHWVIPGLALLGGLPVLGCGMYCIGWYTPDETSFLTPDLAITCWLYCSTLWPAFGALTLASGLAPVAAAFLFWRGNRSSAYLLALAGGMLTLPAGVLPMAAALMARSGQNRQLGG
ncbi:MAG TPA: hypothetical protein VJM51_02105 [Dehalococcoidia bacterium]|nr:hypothetical protein [Dehalococcoidia bacterium]